MLNRILIYNSGGGIGDALQIIPLINALKLEFRNAEFHYLCAHENHFKSSLKDFNININTLKLDIKYFGFRWWHLLAVKRQVKKNKIYPFDLIIDLQSKIRNTLILKLIPHKFFISPCFNFKFSKPNIVVKKEKKIHLMILYAINLSLNKDLKINDFDLNNINKKFIIESEKLLPKNNYIGLSITQGNVYRKKEWPFKNIIEICNEIIKKKAIPVFLIEKKNIEMKNKIKKLVPLALFPEDETFLESPALVTCLGKRLKFAITIDNGIMHMLSLSKVPMISLFGPTDSEKFAPDYKESISLDSKKLYSSKNMADISVEDVLQAAKQYLNF